MTRYTGFTIIELLVVIAILLSLTSIGIPSLNTFIINSRVDSEINQLHRLLLVSRNAAINNNTKVTLCPLDEKFKCINTWSNELSVFTDTNNNKIFEPLLNEKLISQKNAIKKGDSLQYGKTRIGLTYDATGHLSGWGQNATFSYCPKDHHDKSRGIVVATSGRSYVSASNKKDTANIRRSGKKISCL